MEPEFAAAQFAAGQSLPPGFVLYNGQGKHWAVVKEINRGGTAVVYEALDAAGCRVALKVMGLREGRAALPVAQIQREIAYTATLKHPGIVELRDYFSAGELVVLVYELVNGPDLLDLLNANGGRLDEARAARYFAQLISSVAFCHGQGFCHRDIKPENCVLDSATDSLKLIDFGLSKHLHTAVTLGVGTPDYLAPELITSPAGASADVLYNRRVGKYDGSATDVWATGVLLYLITTGVYPFESPLQPTNILATLGNISSGSYRPLPKRMPPQLADLIKGMLTVDPAARLTLQQIAQHPWLAAHGQARPPPAAAAGASTSASAPAREPAALPRKASSFTFLTGAPAAPAAEAEAEGQLLHGYTPPTPCMTMQAPAAPAAPAAHLIAAAACCGGSPAPPTPAAAAQQQQQQPAAVKTVPVVVEGPEGLQPATAKPAAPALPTSAQQPAKKVRLFDFAWCSFWGRASCGEQGEE